MKAHTFLAALIFAATPTAQAQTAAPGGVQESTDPARAAAIEKAAAELKARPAQPSVGLVRATTPAGHTMLCGGNTAGDRASMNAERQDFSLWVATVAKPSGAYLSDVDLRISDLKTKAVVLDRRMEGPWLMIALPPGYYEVSATLAEASADAAQKMVTRVNVPARGQRQAVLRFTSQATVDPEMQDAVRNPFGGPAPKK
jgi:hypothetical protein